MPAKNIYSRHQNASLKDFFSDDEQKRKQARELARETVKNAYNQIPGFFTPFKTVDELNTALAAPIVSPIIFAHLTAFAAITTAAAAVATLSNLVVASGVVLFGQTETAKDRLLGAQFAAMITILGALATVTLALLTAVIVPLTVASLITRSGSSLVSAISNCFFSDPAEKTPAYSPM